MRAAALAAIALTRGGRGSVRLGLAPAIGATTARKPPSREGRCKAVELQRCEDEAPQCGKVKKRAALQCDYKKGFCWMYQAVIDRQLFHHSKRSRNTCNEVAILVTIAPLTSVQA
jgi:hypothetical protein